MSIHKGQVGNRYKQVDELMLLQTSNMPALAPALPRQHAANEYALTCMLVNFSFTVSKHTESGTRIVNKGNVLHRQDYRKWKEWCIAHNKPIV